MGVSFFYAAVQHARAAPDGIYYLVGSLFVTGTSLAFVGILANPVNPIFLRLSPILATLPQNWMNLPQVGAVTVNANEIAGMLCWIVPLLFVITIGLWPATSEIHQARIRLIKWTLLVMLLVNSLILLSTNSRGGILSVFLALLVMLAIQYSWGKWILLIVVLIAGTLLVLPGFMNVGLNFQSTILAFDETGLAGRIEIWSRGLSAVREFPITGMGMNGFRELVPVFYPMILRSPDADIGHAHNHLLQAGLDLGIPGLIAYLSIWLVSAGLLRLAWHNSSARSDRLLILGLFGSLMAGWLFGLLDAISLGAKPGFLWWLLIALTVVVGENVAKNNND
jgi:putative inorganic carbon (HCO3(-)) transporter